MQMNENNPTSEPNFMAATLTGGVAGFTQKIAVFFRRADLGA
jgi:hypothetical protein